MEALKELTVKGSDLIVQFMENDEVRILDYDLDEYVSVPYEELPSLIKTLTEINK